MARFEHDKLVVIDRCILIQKRTDLIGQNEGIVLSDALMGEIAGGRFMEWEPSSFGRWVHHVADRLYIGSYWWDIARHEHSCNKLAKPQHAINWEITENFREKARGDPAAWPQRFLDLRTDGLRGYERERERLRDLADKYYAWTKTQDSGWFLDLINRKLSIEERTKIVQTPSFAAEIAPAVMGIFDGQDSLDRYRSEPWQRALSEFPDRRVVGRWCRLIFWYMMARAAGETKDFGNNWDDAHYAFVASYVGHIATADEGLKAAIRAVFPSVQIRTPVQ